MLQTPEPVPSDVNSVLKDAEKSETFCIYPFTHLATKTEGTFKLCCRSEPISNVQESSAVELWNSAKYKEIRRQLLNGEKPEACQDCWTLESMGTRSMRQRALRTFPGSRWSNYSSLLNQVDPSGHVPYLPKTIELKLSNLCNLKCRMCHPVDSSSWASEWNDVSDLMKKYNQWAYSSAEKKNVTKKPLISGFHDQEQWWLDFAKMAESLDLIEFAGGEPLMDPLHYRILDLLSERAPHIRLKYSTNLTTLSFKGVSVFEYWKNFKSVSIYASIDGIHDVYNYIRTGAQFSTIEKNLDEVQSRKDIVFEEIAVACTIQVYNVFQLPKIIDYFTNRGVRFHSHRVTAPTFLNTQVLPQSLKNKAEGEILEFQEKLITEKKWPQATLNNIQNHIKDHLQHMQGRDWSHLLPALRDYTDRLDNKRHTRILDAAPELRELFI
jgi:sulfatase maturation enzyme AslB (radical SAM superfamily)